MAWNRPTSNTGNATSSSRPSGRGKMPRLRRGLIAGAIVVLGAGLAAWLIWPSSATNNQQPTTSNRSLIKEVMPAAASKAKPDEDRKRAGGNAANQTMAAQDAAKPTPATQTPAEDAASTNKPPLPKKYYASNLERCLDMAIPPRPGVRMPPVPFVGCDESDENSVRAELADIEKGLRNELKAEEGDTDAELERKAIITDAKAEFREMMKEGMTLRQYVRALEEKFNDDAALLFDAQKMVDANYADKTLSDEDYKVLKEKVDKLLADKGLPATDDENTLAEKEAAEAADDAHPVNLKQEKSR